MLLQCYLLNQSLLIDIQLFAIANSTALNNLEHISLHICECALLRTQF